MSASFLFYLREEDVFENLPQAVALAYTRHAQIAKNTKDPRLKELMEDESSVIFSEEIVVVHEYQISFVRNHHSVEAIRNMPFKEDLLSHSAPPLHLWHKPLSQRQIALKTPLTQLTYDDTFILRLLINYQRGFIDEEQSKQLLLEYFDAANVKLGSKFAAILYCSYFIPSLKFSDFGIIPDRSYDINVYRDSGTSLGEILNFLFLDVLVDFKLIEHVRDCGVMQCKDIPGSPCNVAVEMIEPLNAIFNKDTETLWFDDDAIDALTATGYYKLRLPFANYVKPRNISLDGLAPAMGFSDGEEFIKSISTTSNWLFL